MIDIFIGHSLQDYVITIGIVYLSLVALNAVSFWWLCVEPIYINGDKNTPYKPKIKDIFFKIL